MDTDTISRGEYEARHAELTTRVIKVETELNSSYRFMVEENKAIRDDIQTKFAELQESISNVKVSNWKLLALCIINFLIGGGFVEIVSTISKIR